VASTYLSVCFELSAVIELIFTRRFPADFYFVCHKKSGTFLCACRYFENVAVVLHDCRYYRRVQVYRKRTEAAKKLYLKQLATYRASLLAKVVRTDWLR